MAGRPVVLAVALVLLLQLRAVQSVSAAHKGGNLLRNGLHLLRRVHL